MRDDGTVWLNVGDSYASAYACQRRSIIGNTSMPIGRKELRPNRLQNGLKEKDLIGQPWRLAFALQDDGWYLRSDIIWAKPNPMPESVTDRPTKSHEHIFLLTKNPRYFYDCDAVREKNTDSTIKRISSGPVQAIGAGHKQKALGSEHGGGEYNSLSGRNLRDVWNIPTQSFPEAHFATFPEEIPKRCILAGTSEKGCCPKCGAAWVRVVEKGELIPDSPGYKPRGGKSPNKLINVGMTLSDGQPAPNHHYNNKTTGWQPSCDCGNEKPVPCTVLDPFSGAATTGLVAVKYGRKYIGIELNPEYAEMSIRRIDKVARQGLLL